MVASRFDQSMPVGNEGAGTVVKAGSSPAAQALMGKLVAVASGSMYSQYKIAKAAEALVLPNGTTAKQAASCFVNPLTALSMVEVMRREGHKALVHTAAASNLGQMLNKICQRDGVSLVNIVRSAEQANILKEIGAKVVLDSTSPRFMPELIEAVGAAEATLAFDAIGGGMLASQILTAMEAAAAARMTSYSRYGSNTFKQVYIYGVAGHEQDRAHAQFRVVMVGQRLAAHAVPAEDRFCRCEQTAATSRRRADDDFCESLHAGNLAARCGDAGSGAGL